MSVYQHIARQRAQVLRVAPAAEPVWQAAVREAFAHHSQRYGTRRLRVEVQA